MFHSFKTNIFKYLGSKIIPLLGGLGVLLTAVCPLWGSSIPVFSKNGQIQDHMRTIELNSILYVSVNDLANVLWAKQFWSSEKKKMDLKFSGHVITFTLSHSDIVIDREAFHMPLQTLYREGAVWVPVQLFCRILDNALPGWLSWNQDEKRLQILSPGLNITDMTIESKSNGTLITVSALETFSIEHALGPSNWLNVTILGGRLDPEQFSSSSGVGCVTKVRAYQFGASCQISMQLSKVPSDYKVFQREDPSEIVILLRQSQGNDASGSEKNDFPSELKPNQNLALFDLIVLDAGHGGKDPGATGPTGLKEKEIVLDVTKRLANLLRKHLGVNVILTRDDDSYIPLQQRTEIANSTGADLFISIHANAAKRRQVGGCQTFFLSPAKNDEARAVAMLENAALKFEEEYASGATELSDEDFVLRDIVSDMLQSSFLKESEDLAASIQTDMDLNLGIKNRGVDQAGFFVLVGAKMPAVLIEIAFISNTYEEKLLKEKRFRQKIAEAIYNGIQRFKTKYESTM
ncbi:MAG: N-acetylmuramoyl-L-alanine amidase [Gemmatimonadota bacterium]|nr:MAG: N-acetylmuramoyl-L-alanine amidase [Gemmatimonadota bacterium]